MKTFIQYKSSAIKFLSIVFSTVMALFKQQAQEEMYLPSFHLGICQTQQYKAHLLVPKSSLDPDSAVAKTLLLDLLLDTCKQNQNFEFHVEQLHHTSQIMKS